MSALTLTLKPNLSGLSLKQEQVKSASLKEVAKQNPGILDEVEQILARARAEERLYLLEEMKQEGGTPGSFAAKDPHYGFYQSLQTPQNVIPQKEYIYGHGPESLKESIQEMSEDNREHLKNLYESFQGGDSSTYPNATQAGIILRKRQTEAELRLVQLIVNARFNADPYARSIVQTFSRYILGTGVRVNVEDPRIQDVLDNFMQHTKFREFFKDFIETSFKDGEVGLTMQSVLSKRGTKDAKVEWRLRKVFSEEIRAFEYEIEDAGRKYAYFKQYSIIAEGVHKVIERWIPDVNYFYQLNTRGNLAVSFGAVSTKKGLTKDEVMVWFQHGDKRELRGRVPLEPALRDLRLYEDFRINRAILNYERSKVLYIRTGKTGLSKKGDFNIKKSASPKGGVELSLPPGDTYEMATASLQAADADHDGLLFLYAAGSAVNMPVYMFAIRADQQNYGAIKNTDSPFNQMIQDYANQFTATIKDVMKYVIYRSVEAGILESKTKIKRVAREKQHRWAVIMEKVAKILIDEKAEVKPGTTMTMQKYLEETLEDVEVDTIDVPIDVVIADSIKPNPLEWAKVAFIERKLGVVSSQTLSEERGRNWQVEVMRMLMEKELGILDLSGTQDNSSNGGAGGDTSTQTGDGTKNQA